MRYCYGLLERQFRRCFEEAKKRRGNTADMLLQILETRLDNVVYRLGYAPSRAAARQLITHGHLKVNGRRVNVPSYNVKPGDLIEARDNARSRQMVVKSLESAAVRAVPTWLLLEKEAAKGTVSRMPSAEETETLANVQAIVEFYSR